MILTASQLVAMVPRVNMGEWVEPLNDAMQTFGIDTPHRLAGFIGQCAHESANFTQLVENMNYSSDGLANTWPNRYSTGAKLNGRYLPNTLALTIAREPERIANNCYADRMGNGNEASGDGWRFRGRGLIQITGWSNYNDASRALGIDYLDAPDLIERPVDAARVSAWWFAKHGCLAACDDADWLGLSRIINVGNRKSTAMPIGQGDREARIQRCLAVLAPKP